MDPRYAAMFQQGAKSWIVSGRNRTPFDDIDARCPRGIVRRTGFPAANIVTIMFTDMVGSTQLTQRRGDTAAQDYVRAHNAIVRAALTQHQGVEVKHTGDGIMASFGAPSFALDAAIAIQKAVRAHNALHPQREFRLRIGINAGEPIIEDDDMFGVAVQLAARICSAADPDHILIANVVRELLAGKAYPIQALEPRVLRGIKEPQILHDVAWTEIPDPPQPVTDPPAAEPPPSAEAAPTPETDGTGPAAPPGP
jgi:adenylate cyclase